MWSFTQLKSRDVQFQWYPREKVRNVYASEAPVPSFLGGALKRIRYSPSTDTSSICLHQGGGHHPLCQTIYAHYLLHLHDLDVGDKEKLEGIYTNITQSAIHNGMLQDSLEEINPNSDYIVEGAGSRVLPTVHKHHTFHLRRLGCRQRLLQGWISDGFQVAENYANIAGQRRDVRCWQIFEKPLENRS